jgi:hydrogenase 3 maturation protease
MNMLMGVGSTLRRDDGVGVYVARRLRHEAWTSLDCGTAPENFTAVVRREHPGLLVIVDAADMGLPPGEIRRIPPERIRDAGIGTHQLPLTHLVHFLADAADRILIIGIQPADTDDGEGMTHVVRDAADRLIVLIAGDDLAAITEF